MQAVIKNYFDDETLVHVGTKFFLDNEEVDFEDYKDFVSELLVEQNENECACSQDENCEQCDCSECCGCENTECCEENRDEDNDLGEQECECPICSAEREVQDLECYCDECVDQYMKDFIGECLERVFNGCEECAVESVVKLAFKCLNLGKKNVKQNMFEFLED